MSIHLNLEGSFECDSRLVGSLSKDTELSSQVIVELLLIVKEQYNDS